MLDLIYPMGAVLLSWLLLFLLFSGLGIIVLRLLGQRMESGTRLLDAFWLGWSLALALLQVWHFAFPVNDLLLAILAAAAAILLYSQRRAIGQIVRRLWLTPSFVLLYVLVALWMANRSLGMPIAYDTGFRDIQAVMWIDAYPIVPGLANLFSSLGYNHSVYLYDALLDASIWSGRSFYIATGLLLMVYLAFALHAALQMVRHRCGAGLRWSWIFATLTIPYVMYYTIPWGGITHFLTDTVVDLLGFLTTIYLLDFLQDRDAPSGARYYGILRLAILILAGFTVKQTFIVYGLTTGVLAVVVWLRRGGAGLARPRIRSLALFTGIWALALFVPWMIRGVVTSGYVAYPHSIGRVEVDWVLPVEHIEVRQRNLAANTRLRGVNKDEVLSSWQWLAPWLERLLRNVMTTVLPAIITTGSLCFYLAGIWRNRRHRFDSALGLYIMAPICLTLVVWFFSYPNEKYVRYIFWSCGALSLMLALFSWPKVRWRQRILVIYAVLALCLGFVMYSIIRQETWPLSAGPDDGFYAHPLPPIREFETSSGLKVNAPDSRIAQCWHIPLPCTPYPAINLTSRVSGDIASGFRLEWTESGDRTDA